MEKREESLAHCGQNTEYLVEQRHGLRADIQAMIEAGLGDGEAAEAALRDLIEKAFADLSKKER